MPGRHHAAMFNDGYKGIALGVECAWPQDTAWTAGEPEGRTQTSLRSPTLSQGPHPSLPDEGPGVGERFSSL